MNNISEAPKKKMSLFVATALVVGNMVGSGIFMLPNTLAHAAGPGSIILAWLFTGIGSIFLALSFARLGSVIPKTGGPYEYSKEAFGDFVGFSNAWLYWNGSWIGNAAVIIAIASYAGAIFPIINNNSTVGFLVCSGVLWIVTYVNIKGVELAGKVGSAITVFKLLVLLLFIIIAAINFDSTNMTPMFPSGKGIETLPAAATITLWAFVGLETASITGGEIENPKKNIYKSTVYGILIACIFYIAISFFAMGAMSQSEMMTSSAPISDILVKFCGTGIMKWINASIVIGIIGTAVGWVLSSARIAFAAGEDGTFPKFFAIKSKKYGTPAVALIISSALTNVVLLMNFTKGFSEALSVITLLATLSYLPIYAITAVSDIIIMSKNEKLSLGYVLKKSIIPMLGFIYAMWTIYGSGAETVMYGFLLMMSGVPVYAYIRIKHSRKAGNS